MPRPNRDESPRRSTSPRRRDRAIFNGDKHKPSSPKDSNEQWDIDRGRSRVRRPSNPFSEDSLRRKGYHTLVSSFGNGQVFHVEKRWKLVREMGSGAYGFVISAADEISGETVAIKLVTRVFEKIQLAKRALREITLLRHFSSHENITGLIDVDAISPDFNEIYIFMEPMEADLHQIIRSGQTLTNEHVQYFVYQILRGMKYIHSASVIHRDLKPGNLLVNADCELKICDFGLSRGFESQPDEHTPHLTEYVATRWYRAPEIMLVFRRYDTSIDVWSIGCIFAELITGKPLFKGKDYVDQLNKILDVLGTPEERIIQRIGSEKAQKYVRSLPFKKRIPYNRLMPSADPSALDLLAKMLTFDPHDRITVPQALEHDWLFSYHDEADEPECPRKFERWKEIEKLQTLDEYRDALWNEIEDYRREVRGVSDLSGMPIHREMSVSGGSGERRDSMESSILEVTATAEPDVIVESPDEAEQDKTPPSAAPTEMDEKIDDKREAPRPRTMTESSLTAGALMTRRRTISANDPVISYARRSSILQSSAYSSPQITHQKLPSFTESPQPAPGSIVFPSQQGYVLPARSRTGSTAGGEVTRKLLRTLSTVSIHESSEGLAGGLAQIAPIGKFIVERETGADAPASEMPREFGIEE